MTTRRAIVVGAGIAGLSSAIALRDAGWHVRVFEDAPNLEPMGAALSLWPNAMAALDRLGCGDPLRQSAEPIATLALATDKGRDIMRNAPHGIIGGGYAYLPTRSLLQSTLTARLGHDGLMLGQRLTNFVPTGDGVIVHFESGLSAEADLLVAADGIRSRIAEQLGVGPPVHAGYGGVLALSDPVQGAPLDGNGTEYWGAGERFGLFDLGSGRRYWFYMKNEAQPTEASRTTLDFVRSRVSSWRPEIEAAIEATPTERLIPFSVHAKPPPRRIGFGRVALVGDAAHAMEPNLGQGACQALEDAVALGIAAHSGGATHLVSRYERMRLERARTFVRLSRQGSVVPHRLPSPLAALSKAVMGPAFRIIAPRQMRALFQLPDYEGIA